jgi:hypothetical protein
LWELRFNREKIKQVREIRNQAEVAGQVAEREAKAKGTFPETPDIANAIRHVVGSAKLTLALGTTQAKKITDIHEDGARDKRDSYTDQLHNAIGREIGAASKSDAEIARKTAEALKAGRLILNQDKDKRIPPELQKRPKP